MIDVSIIFVNYKTAQHIINCVNSIVKQTKKVSYEIIVIDNASEDDSEIKIKNAIATEIQWLQMGYNSGFARANNAGIKLAKGKYILLLNGDTIILDAAIDKTIAFLENNTDTAAVGVQLLNTDGSNQISGAIIIKGGLNILLPLPYIGRLIRYIGYKFKSTIPSITNANTTEEVDWIIGAYIASKKEIVNKAGLMDEDFFMYAEEMEWCSRLKKYGSLKLLGNIKVTHIGGGASSNSYKQDNWDNSSDLWSKKARQIMLSNLVRVRKEFGIFWYIICQIIFIITIPISIAFNTILFCFRKNKYNYEMLLGFTKNVISNCKYIFNLLTNRRYFYKIK